MFKGELNDDRISIFGQNITLNKILLEILTFESEHRGSIVPAQLLSLWEVVSSNNPWPLPDLQRELREGRNVL